MLPNAVKAAINLGVRRSMGAKLGSVAHWLQSVRQHLKVVE
jgi:hypothetical protein